MCADDGTSHRGGRGQPRRAGVETVRDRRVVVRPFPAQPPAGDRGRPGRPPGHAHARAVRSSTSPPHGSLLGSHEPPLSLTAFVVASIGRAAAAHSEVHAYRDWRGRLVEHRYVDVQTLIEIPTSQGPFGLVQVVRDADIRSVADISAELRAVKADSSTTASGRLLTTLGPALGHVPGLYPLMYAGDEPIPASPPRHRHRPGHRGRHVRRRRRYAVAPPTLASLLLVVGGVSRRPRAIGDRVELRDVLDLTLTIDHNVVDGSRRPQRRRRQPGHPIRHRPAPDPAHRRCARPTNPTHPILHTGPLTAQTNRSRDPQWMTTPASPETPAGPGPDGVGIVDSQATGP